LCSSFALIVVHGRKDVQMPMPDRSALVSLRNFNTVLDENGPRLRVAGDSLTVSPLKLFGPFRLGVAHSLIARAVTIETFPDTDPRSRSQSQAQSFGHFLASLKPSFNRFLASLLLGQVSVVIAQAECRPLKIVQHAGDQLIVVFAAASCRTKLGSTKVLCKDGTIRARGSDMPFRELSYDGQIWKLRTPLGQKELVDADLLG